MYNHKSGQSKAVVLMILLCCFLIVSCSDDCESMSYQVIKNTDMDVSSEIDKTGMNSEHETYVVIKSSQDASKWIDNHILNENDINHVDFSKQWIVIAYSKEYPNLVSAIQIQSTCGDTIKLCMPTASSPASMSVSWPLIVFTVEADVFSNLEWVHC